MINLKEYGYTDRYAVGVELRPDEMPARITEVHRDLFKIVCEHGETNAVLKGTFLHEAKESGDFPSVGDFVLINYNDSGSSRITKLLERRSKFSRADNDGGFEQMVAANFDYVFIVMSLNKDFNISRLERYLTVSWESGAVPVVILTKADLCEDYNKQVSAVYKAAGMVDVVACSSHTGLGIDALGEYLKPGKTIVLLGSSGVGKSSLVNVLAEEGVMAVNTIREDDSKGRHTTTHRQMIKLESGALIIDTPGMRELGLWNVEEGIGATFSDIEELAEQCRFGDCNHGNEPGCAIKGAMKTGELTVKRWESYQKQKREAAYAEDKVAAMRQRAQTHKEISKYIKQIYKK